MMMKNKGTYAVPRHLTWNSKVKVKSEVNSFGHPGCSVTRGTLRDHLESRGMKNKGIYAVPRHLTWNGKIKVTLEVNSFGHPGCS